MELRSVTFNNKLFPRGDTPTRKIEMDAARSEGKEEKVEEAEEAEKLAKSEFCGK